MKDDLIDTYKDCIDALKDAKAAKDFNLYMIVADEVRRRAQEVTRVRTNKYTEGVDYEETQLPD